MSFLTATRFNKRRIASIPYDGGNRVSYDLPATGLLANLYLRMTGTLTTTLGGGTATLKANQQGRPFGLLDRIQLTANSGTDIVNVTGFGLFLRALMTDNGYPDIASANLSEAESGNPVYQFPTTFTGAQTVEFSLKIPIVNNDRDLTGLIMLQNKETLLTLQMDFADISSLFTLTGGATVSFTGDVTLTTEYFSVPGNREDYPDLSVIHTLIEDRVPIDGVGDLQYVTPRGNVYMRMLHRVLLNDTPAGYDDIDRLTLQFNQTDTPYFIDGHDVLVQQRERYKRDLPKGVYVWDWTYQGQAGLGGSRDLINSRAITDFLSIIKINTSATLGTNNNKLLTVREQLVPLT